MTMVRGNLGIRILQKRGYSSGQHLHSPLLAVILGPPGGGKGTISKKIVRDFGYHHMSTGDMLRAHVRNKTPLGEEASTFMSSGALVPDKLIIGMIMDELNKVPAGSRLLLDGFPRTEDQAHALDCQSSPVGMALSLTVPTEEIVQRASDRWIHPESGRTYSYTYSPPKVEGKDDETGEALVQRDDDKPDVVRKRLSAYDTMTKPLLSYYHGKGVLAQFSGEDAPDLVAADRRSDAIYQGLRLFLERAHARLEHSE